MRADEKFTYVAEELTEIRYKPSGSFLDQIGQIADIIEGKGLFPHWEIDQHAINFRDSAEGAKKTSAFITYNNAGYISFDAPTQNFFHEKASSFWKNIEQLSIFKIPPIQRLGLRNKCFVKVNHTFETLEKKLFDSLFSLDISAKIGGKRMDSQVVFDLVEKDKNIRLILGPLKPDEAKKHFRFESEHFSSAGLFIDIDIYKDGAAKNSDVASFIKDSSNSAWEKINIIAALIGE